jgi:hypothetical protein
MIATAVWWLSLMLCGAIGGLLFMVAWGVP